MRAARYAADIERQPATTGRAEELWQRRANRRNARLKLIQLNRWSRLALLEEDDAADHQSQTHAASARVQARVERNRRLFEEMTGIAFAQQREFRTRLEELVISGTSTVDELLHDLSRTRRNGSVDTGASWTSSDG